MDPTNTPTPRFRWVLLAASFIIMMVISIYQYSWFLFASVLREQHGWLLPAIGITFTVFTYAATFIQPFSGYIADSFGPRMVAVSASALTGLGLLLSSLAPSPLLLYLSYGLGGVGVGALYGISTACAVKWFPDRRGLAAGLVVFGFGAGTAVFNLIVRRMLETLGLQTTFAYLGAAMLVILIPLSLMYRFPATAPAASAGATKPGGEKLSDFRPLEMLKTYQWYLIYFSFTFTISVVLIFGAQMKMVAEEYGLPEGHFSILLVLFPLGNGLSRVLAGSVSDKIGREKTMVLFYSLLACSIFAFVLFAHVPLLFVAIVFVAALLGGAPFALYPATIGDYYGSTYSTTNYGITYTAKAFAGLISGWLSGFLVMHFGSYRLPLTLVAVGSLFAALISLPAIMKAPRRRT